MRGLGWGKKHSVVDYVFTHPYSWLFRYHQRVMDEMKRRGFHVASLWKEQNYRGQKLGFDNSNFCFIPVKVKNIDQIYPEHTPKYVFDCLLNLHRKGIEL